MFCGIRPVFPLRPNESKNGPAGEEGPPFRIPFITLSREVGQFGIDALPTDSDESCLFYYYYYL